MTNNLEPLTLTIHHQKWDGDYAIDTKKRTVLDVTADIATLNPNNRQHLIAELDSLSPDLDRLIPEHIIDGDPFYAELAIGDDTEPTGDDLNAWLTHADDPANRDDLTRHAALRTASDLRDATERIRIAQQAMRDALARITTYPTVIDALDDGTLPRITLTFTHCVQTEYDEVIPLEGNTTSVDGTAILAALNPEARERVVANINRLDNHGTAPLGEELIAALTPRQVTGWWQVVVNDASGQPMDADDLRAWFALVDTKRVQVLMARTAQALADVRATQGVVDEAVAAQIAAVGSVRAAYTELAGALETVNPSEGTAVDAAASN